MAGDVASWLTARPIAHRGLHDGNRLVWENSPSAFEAAARAGYAVECDVHQTRDGVPVVFHDEDLERLTGTKGLVHDLTAAELGALSIGGTSDQLYVVDAAAGIVVLLVTLLVLSGAAIYLRHRFERLREG